MKKIYPILFSAVLTILVFWGMFQAGYILLLDMVFGPFIKISYSYGSIINTLPLRSLMSVASMIVEGWAVQKAMLVLVFFLLFYIPLRFYPFKNIYGERYLASLIFAINPFVYERFLAGQWLVVAGYALLPTFLYFLINFFREPSWKKVVGLYFSLFILSVFSFHIFVMCSLVFGVYAFFNILRIKEYWVKLLVGGIALVVLCSYWILPYAYAPQGRSLDAFTEDHWDAFKTASDPTLGTLGNVLSLHGFWGEGMYHENQYLTLKQNVWWLYSLGLLWMLVLLGIVYGLKNKETRKTSLLLLFVSLFAFVFSVGLGDSFLKPFNMWFFDHLSFWKGFRDSQKWSAFLGLSFALFGALGARVIIEKLNGRIKPIFIIMLLALIPMSYVPFMFFGFGGQVKPVWYPEGWKDVNEILKKDEDCRALFLPWHQYYTLEFNHDILTANASKAYFNCIIVAGENMELGNVDTQGGNSLEYYEIEELVTSNVTDPDETIKRLKEKGTKYIIFTNDVADEDIYEYPFLNSGLIQRVVDKEGVYLFTIS